MTREQIMTSLAVDLTGTINCFGRRDDILIRYADITEESALEFSPWTRSYHSLLPGREFFLVYETEKPITELPNDYRPDPTNLLYAVNVSGDSYLTAAAELMDLASRKCL